MAGNDATRQALADGWGNPLVMVHMNADGTFRYPNPLPNGVTQADYRFTFAEGNVEYWRVRGNDHPVKVFSFGDQRGGNPRRDGVGERATVQGRFIYRGTDRRWVSAP